MSDHGDVPEAVLELMDAYGYVGGQAEYDALLAAIAPAFRDAKRLRAFALACVRASRDLAGWRGDIEGGEFQDIATRYGVLVAVTADELCGLICPCAETGGFPVTCYRLAPDIDAARAAEERTE